MQAKDKSPIPIRKRSSEAADVCIKATCVCVRAFVSEKRGRAVHCAALVRKKKSEVFFFGSRHTQGDKLGFL